MQNNARKRHKVKWSVLVALRTGGARWLGLAEMTKPQRMIDLSCFRMEASQSLLIFPPEATQT
eukprot:2316937-Amphidinium_carterae.1